MLSEEQIRRYLLPTHDDGTTPDQITALEIDHACQLGLCDVLERIADELPVILDKPVARVVIEVLRVGMPGHTRIEEEVLFPLLRRHAESAPELPAFLAQLEQEHAHDHEFAHEISDELETLVETGKSRNPDMLGYMLRGYFTSLRRHIKWENATIVPLARRMLTANDLAELELLVTEHRAAMPSRRVIRSIVADNRRGSIQSSQSGQCSDSRRDPKSTGNGSGYA